MVAAVVQTKTVQMIAASTSSTATQLTFDSPVTVGNWMVGVHNGWDSASHDSTTPTDTLSSTWQQAAKSSVGCTGNGGTRTTIYYARIGSTGTPTITFRNMDSPTYGRLAIAEISGLTTAPLDVTKTNAFTRAGSNTDANTGQTTSPGQAAGITIAGCCIYELSTNMAISTVASTGYTNFGIEQDGANNVAGTADYKVESSTAVRAANWSHNDLTNDGQGWSAALAHFLAASTGSAGIPRHAYYYRRRRTD